MARWTENVSPASFGGFEFFADADKEREGLRVANHSLIGGPVRVQVLGPASRTITVRGYFGDDMSPNADPYKEYLRFADFVRAGNRATFVHPNFGRIPRCLAIDLQRNTSDRDGGLVTFTMILTVNPDAQYLVPAQPATSQLENASRDLRRGSLEYFSGTYLDETSPSLRANSVDAAFQAPQSEIESNSWVNKITEFGRQIKRTRGALFGGAQSRLDKILSSVSGPLNTVNEATSLMADINFTVTRFQDAPTSLRGLQSLLNYYSRRPFFPTNGNTAYHNRARHNENVFNLTLSGLLTAAIGDTMSTSPIRETFGSRNDAVAYINDTEESIHRVNNDLLKAGVSPKALTNTQTALVKYSEEFLPQLSRVRTVNSATRNAAVLSHRYLRNVSETRKVVEENNALYLFELPKEVEVRVV